MKARRRLIALKAARRRLAKLIFSLFPFSNSHTLSLSLSLFLSLSPPINRNIEEGKAAKSATNKKSKNASYVRPKMHYPISKLLKKTLNALFKHLVAIKIILPVLP